MYIYIERERDVCMCVYVNEFKEVVVPKLVYTVKSYITCRAYLHLVGKFSVQQRIT